VHECNWAGNYAYRARILRRPATLEQVQELATSVAALELVRSDGSVITTSRGEPEFDGLVVGLGATGAVTRVALDVEPE